MWVLKLSKVESWAEAQGTEASEGSREPVYHCALTQGWKEQGQGIPNGKGRQAQNYFALGVGDGGGLGEMKQARLSHPLREPGHCPASNSEAARPQKGAPGRCAPSSFSRLTHSVASGLQASQPSLWPLAHHRHILSRIPVSCDLLWWHRHKSHLYCQSSPPLR